MLDLDSVGCEPEAGGGTQEEGAQSIEAASPSQRGKHVNKRASGSGQQTSPTVSMETLSSADDSFTSELRAKDGFITLKQRYETKAATQVEKMFKTQR